MAEPVDPVAEHYRCDDLLSMIEAGLRQMGKNVDAILPEDLRAADEFHIGGAEATDEILDRLDLPKGTRALDIGAGLGGPARHMAGRGFDVTGIDLTPEYVMVAQEMSRRAGVPTRFVQGSATDLPFPDAAFDLVTLIHVGMNILDKPALFAEAARVMKPGGTFAVYDVMKLGEAHPEFPLPWASQPETSALDLPEAYLDAAEVAGLSLTHRRERGAYARDFFARMVAAMSDQGTPALGVHLLMGETAQQKIANMVAALEAGMIAPVELFFRRAPSGPGLDAAPSRCDAAAGPGNREGDDTMIESLDHINIRTGNLAAMVAWYRDVLGMEEGARPDFAFDGAWMYAGDQPVVHLVAVDKTPEDGPELRLEHGAFRASGYRAFVDRLEESGTRYRIRKPPGMSIVQVNVWDPDGNHMHVDFDAAETPEL